MPRLTTMSRRTLRMAGIVVPVVRALPEVLYQFERPFVVDAGETTETFGIEPTPWVDAVVATLAAYGVDRVPVNSGSAAGGGQRRA